MDREVGRRLAKSQVKVGHTMRKNLSVPNWNHPSLSARSTGEHDRPLDFSRSEPVASGFGELLARQHIEADTTGAEPHLRRIPQWPRSRRLTYRSVNTPRRSSIVLRCT